MLPITGKHASRNAMTIVTHAYRPKRARKRKAQAALSVPAIVRAGRKREEVSEPATLPAPANDHKSAIVTAKHPRRHGSVSDVPDMTPEEHKRRGDAADALFREIVRRATAKDRP